MLASSLEVRHSAAPPSARRHGCPPSGRKVTCAARPVADRQAWVRAAGRTRHGPSKARG